MKKNEINQRGFVFIPLLMIALALAVVASVSTGVVLHKQGKLTSLKANTLGVFEKIKEVATTEEIESDEPKTEQSETGQEAKAIKEETEETGILAKTEKAKEEAKKAGKEAEQTKIKANNLKEKVEEKDRIANIKAVDKELSQIISETKKNVDIFSRAKNEAISFIPTVRNTMNKYPDSLLVQQSGQQLIDENNNLSFIAGKLFNIENERIKILSSSLGSGATPSVNDFSTSKTQYENYRNQYDLSIIKIKSLMETFVINEKTVLSEMLREKREELQLAQEANSLANKIAVKQEEINAIINDYNQKIENESNRLASMSIIRARQAKLEQEKQSKLVIPYQELQFLINQ